MFAKVIVGFDGSEQAHDALALSEVLTAADGELLVCCVHRFKGITSRVDPAEPRLDQATAERSVQAACGLLHGPYRIVPLIVPGAGAAETLKHNATKQRAELLVLGSSHRGPVGHMPGRRRTFGISRQTPTRASRAHRARL
jgi:nucleotide-binding universal stress UspA family protein